MAADDKILKILMQIQSDLSGLKDLKSGMDDLKKSTDDAAKAGFSFADAFKFAGVDQGLEKVLEVLKDVTKEFVSFVEESVKKSAELQTEAFPITQLIGNAEKAKEIIGGIDSIWQQVGVVSNQSLSETARNLLIMGTSVDNLNARIIEFTKLSLAAGTEAQNIVFAYERLKMAIETGTMPAMRMMGQQGAAMLVLFKTLEDQFGVTEGKLREMFKNGQVSLDDLNKSIRAATDTGGQFFNVIEEKKQTFDGAVQAMRTAWEGFEQQLGTPIIQALTPVINQITNIERALEKIAEDHGWQVAIEAAWQIVMYELQKITSQILIEAFLNLGPAAADAFFEAWVSRIKNLFSGQDFKNLFAGKLSLDAVLPVDVEKFGQVLIERMTKGASEKIPDLMKLLQDTIKQVSGTTILPPETPEQLDKVNKSGKELSATIKELETLLQAIHQQQQLINQSPLLSVDDKNTLLLQSYTNEIRALQQEISKLSALKGSLLDPNQIQEADQKLQQATFQVQLLGEKVLALKLPFTTQLVQWANQFDSAARQAATALTNSLGTAIGGVSQALSGLIFGTKNWQQAITQAAESIVSDLIRIALQFVVSRTIMSAVNRAAGTAEQSTATAQASTAFLAWEPAAIAASTASYGVAASVGLASFLSAEAGGLAGAVAGVLHSGGPVRGKRMHGGGLAHNEVPIIAEEGEIMMPNSVTQQPGMAEFLLGMIDSYHIGGPIRRMHGGGRFGGGDDPYPPGEVWGEPVPAWSEPTPLPSPSPYPISAMPFPTTGGPQVIVPTESDVYWGAEPVSMRTPSPHFGFSTPSGTPFILGPGGIPYYGTSPPGGSVFGPTIIPTMWVNYPGLGPIPMAPAVDELDPSTSGPNNIGAIAGIPPWFFSGLSGGGGGGASQFIPRALHKGGLIGSSPRVSGVPRFHAGGSVGPVRGGGVHVYAFTDLKQLTKHMGSRDGQKIIFDTIRGRRLDLGIG